MSDPLIMRPADWDVSLVALPCAAFLAVVTSTWWFVRYRHHAVRRSVVLTSLVALPGVAMTLELALRLVEWHVLRMSIPPVFDFFTTGPSCLWSLAGPVLLLTGFVRRKGIEEIPTSTNLVQAVHVALWLVSSWVALMFAAAV